MFDDFKDSQEIGYSILMNAIKNNKLSHAYLIDTNNCRDSFSFVMSLAKVIICPSNYSNYSKCGNCNICKRIDDNNFMELRIIKPDGLNIKKEQLLDLQDSFSLYGVESSKRVYIIYDCDKMTLQASNSLLKFLEEPASNIYAILVTNNINKMISTVISRCQIIKLKKDKINLFDKAILNFASMYGNNNIEEFISDEKNLDIINKIIDFIKYYEENGLDILIYSKNMWHSNFKDRATNVMAINLVINFYYDVFKIKCGNDSLFFKDYLDIVEMVSSRNSIESIINKLNVSINALEMIKSNINIMLVIDNMIIEFGGDSYEFSAS